MSSIDVICQNEIETARLAESLGLALRLGDLVTLSGDLGAGKTALTRALIRAVTGDAAIEVPSPTFTLVQAYENLSFGTLAHIDLYRLEDPSEIDELGLEDALTTGVAVIEWPEKGGDVLPEPALSVKITHGSDDTRIFNFKGQSVAITRLNRSLALRAFLDGNGHQKSKRQHLTGDASTRSYETIIPVDGPSIIAMNAPTQPDGEPIKDGKAYSQIAKLAEDMSAFVGVGQALVSNGFRAPNIYTHDLQQGFMLIEDLGEGKIVDDKSTPIPDRYLVSMETLAAIHNETWSANCPVEEHADHVIPLFDREAMMIEVELLAQWYAPYKTGRSLQSDEAAAFDKIWHSLIDELSDSETSLVLRDFHSPNIIWMEDGENTDRIGIIDFQDALIGPTAYDVASIAQDARVDVSAQLETQLVDHYCNERISHDEANFRKCYAILAAQRVTKVLGIFVRLSKRDRKDAYLTHLPRMEDYLSRSLSHPALANYRAWVENTLNG